MQPSTELRHKLGQWLKPLWRDHDDHDDDDDQGPKGPPLLSLALWPKLPQPAGPALA